MRRTKAALVFLRSPSSHQQRKETCTWIMQSPIEEFILELLREGARQDGPSVIIRDFQRTMSSLISGKPEDNDQVIPLRMLNVAYNGDISTFSPELLALSAAERQRYIFGNVHYCNTLTDVLDDERFVAAYQEISNGVDRCARECEYFQYCGGGAPVNKLSEKGTMDAAETTFCTLTKKAWVNACLQIVNATESRFEVVPAI